MSILAKSAQGVSLQILLQVGSRGLTFLLNQGLLRYLTLDILGHSAQLELFSITVLFFARESIRVACQRRTESLQSAINLGFLPVLIGIPLATTLSFGWLYFKQTEIPFFTHSVIIYAISAIIELLSEPYFIAAQQLLLFRVRADAEASATLAKCLATLGAAIYADKIGLKAGVLVFAIGQLVYASVLVIRFISQLSSIKASYSASLLPKPIETDSQNYIMGYFPKDLVSLSLSFFLQNTFKYVLTQGDGLLIASMASAKEQGAYALASNYGGLVARLIFQPIEETSRNIFAQLCYTKTPENDTEIENTKQNATAIGKKKVTNKSSKIETATKKKIPDENTEDETSETSNNIEQAKQLLTRILKMYNIFGLVAVTIGPVIAPIALEFVAGNRFVTSDSLGVIKTFCYYIPLLAINGVSEGFVAAAASNAILNIQSGLMFLWFFAFWGSAYYFMNILHYGATGIVFANCINMALRISFNSWFVQSFFKRNTSSKNFTFLNIIPNLLSITLSVGTLGVNLTRQNNEVMSIIDAVKVSAIYVSLVLFFNRDFIISLSKDLTKKR